MGSAAILLALVVLVVGGWAGWHVRHAYGASADLKVHKTRIPNFRKVRNRSYLNVAFVVIIVLLVLRALAK
jgi:TRAP-type C4-dicarboxylate transport system permease small subunit